MKKVSLPTGAIALGLVTGSIACLAYAMIAFQNMKAAAALPFAMGQPDHRHVWWPMAAGILLLLMAAGFIAFGQADAPDTPDD